jgi:hypothetical protein
MCGCLPHRVPRMAKGGTTSVCWDPRRRPAGRQAAHSREASAGTRAARGPACCGAEGPRAGTLRPLHLVGLEPGAPAPCGPGRTRTSPHPRDQSPRRPRGRHAAWGALGRWRRRRRRGWRGPAGCVPRVPPIPRVTCAGPGTAGAGRAGSAAPGAGSSGPAEGWCRPSRSRGCGLRAPGRGELSPRLQPPPGLRVGLPQSGSLKGPRPLALGRRPRRGGRDAGRGARGRRAAGGPAWPRAPGPEAR